jgi:ABC-type transport system involved in cytochrome bd biosynthesis fused ATPase/permease subunit
MKKQFLILAAGIAVVGLAGAQTMMGKSGYVRVVHAISDAPQRWMCT